MGTVGAEAWCDATTPDDEGHRKGHLDERLSHVRQNVVLELGMLLASPNLGRRRVAILLKEQGDMERPSDIQGLIYIGSPQIGVGGFGAFWLRRQQRPMTDERLRTEVDLQLRPRAGCGGRLRCRGGGSCGPTGASTRCARPPHALRP